MSRYLGRDHSANALRKRCEVLTDIDRLAQRRPRSALAEPEPQEVTIHRVTGRGLLATLDQLNGLSPQLQAVLDIIASGRGGIVSRETIAEALYGDRADGGALCVRNVIAVCVCRLRKAGFPVVTHCGRGMSIAPGWRRRRL